MTPEINCGKRIDGSWPHVIGYHFIGDRFHFFVLQSMLMRFRRFPISIQTSLISLKHSLILIRTLLILLQKTF